MRTRQAKKIIMQSPSWGRYDNKLNPYWLERWYNYDAELPEYRTLDHRITKALTKRKDLRRELCLYIDRKETKPNRWGRWVL